MRTRVFLIAALVVGGIAAPGGSVGATALPVVRVAEANTLLQSRGGPLKATAAVTLDSPSATAVTVDYLTVTQPGDLAVPGVHYVATAGTLAFLPGQTQRDVKLTVLPGTVPGQYGVTFHLQIQNAVGATIGDALDEVTIQPTMAGFKLQGGSRVYFDSGTKGRMHLAKVTFALSEKTDHAVTGDYSEGSSSAYPGIDFVAKTGSITIPAGKLSATVTIKIITRKGPLPGRSFVVAVQNTQGVPGQGIAGALIGLRPMP